MFNKFKLLRWALLLLLAVTYVPAAKEKTPCSFTGEINGVKTRSKSCKIVRNVAEPYLLIKAWRNSLLYEIELSGIANPEEKKYELVTMANIGRFDRNIAQFSAEAKKKGSFQKLENINVRLVARRETSVKVKGTFRWRDIKPKKRFCFACDCID